MMRLLLIIIVAFIPILCFGQQKTERFFFDENWKRTDSSKAEYIREIIEYDASGNRGKVIDFYINGSIISETEYSDIRHRIKDGLKIQYHDKGSIKSKVMYKYDELDGECITFYDDGKIRRYDIYKNDKLVSGSCFSKEGEEIEHFPYWQPPQYLGGIDALFAFIIKNIKYPRLAKSRGVEGRVVVSVLIDEKGQVNYPRVVQSADKLLDKEAINVVKIMRDWFPGYEDGYPIRTRVTIPIAFKLR